MNILRRVAVVTGDMAALEAPVQHMGILRMLSADGFQLAGQLRVARSAVEGTQIEVRQFAVEQVRDQRADRVRIEQQRITELGLEAMSYTDKGELVPDSLTNKIVKDRLAKEDCKNGWILDGYPRNAAQVTALDEMLADLDTPLDHVVALEAARDVLLERMKKRAAEQGRADDTPEAIAKRLETYEKETAPLLDIYEARGLLVVVNGVGDIDEISGRIISHLE